MRLIALCLFVLATFGGVMAQNLADSYATGAVVLQEDTQYGAGTDWKQVFAIPAVGSDDGSVEAYRSLAVAGDGTAFVCNYDSYTIQKFDPSGRLLKTFGEQGSGVGQFRNRPRLHGVLDDKYIFTSEHNGRLTFFDLNGQHLKTIELDYMPLQCTPLRDGKVAVVGHVPWSEGRTRNIVAVIDFNGGEEIIVCSRISENVAFGAVNLTTREGHTVSFVGSSAQPGGWVVARASDGTLITNHTDDQKVETFTPEGHRLNQFAMMIDRIRYSESERSQIGVKLSDIVDKIGVSREELQKALDSVKHPEFLPYTYSLMVDYDGNLLAFVYTDEKEGHRFQAYRMTPTGQLIGKVDFVSDRYELNFNPHTASVQFANGYLYAVATVKGDAGAVRLIRGKLAAR